MYITYKNVLYKNKKIVIYIRVDCFFVQFSFYQKTITKPNFFLKKKTNRNRFKVDWLGFFGLGSVRFGLVFSVLDL